ncbi:DMT family transporter [Paraferrimonas sp. SM1919]|uniref:DMT family transporter n=1 Tax=Paraferrimonas sp. SM1919 TaxID=2662263 RepID=UPI0013D8290C|nr:DMT family transporter [Paraferrimonas sp. SM1919]
MTYKHYFFAFAAIFFWSTVATAFKIALESLTVPQLLLIASVFSWLSLLVIVAINGKLGRIKAQFRQKPGYYLIVALFNPVLYYLALFKAYDLLPAQQALSLNYTWAVLLPLLAAPILKQSLTLKDISCALIAYFGVVVIATKGDFASMSFDSPLGVGLALLSTLFWCGYWLLNTKAEGDANVSLFISFSLAIPMLVIVNLGLNDWHPITLNGLMAGAYVGLFEMGITFALWLQALKLAPKAASVSNLVFLSPILSIVWIALILGEKIEVTTLVGLGFILAALLFQKIGKAGS